MTNLRYGTQTRAENDSETIANLIRKGWEVYTPELVVEVPPSITAEEHLAAQGYSPLRLLTCLDLEGKLRSIGATSPALAAVRHWVDSLTVAAAIDTNATRSDWPAAPALYEEVLTEAISALNSETKIDSERSIS